MSAPKAPVFLTPREQLRYRRRGVAEGAAALKAVSPERKGRKLDIRDDEERLTDLLCSLRVWADVNGVDFMDVFVDATVHYRIESGQLAENFRDL